MLDFGTRDRQSFFDADPSQPIATGSEATVVVAFSGGRAGALVIRSAVSDNPELLDVRRITDNRFTVFAHQAGETRIEVMTNRGADWAYFDSFEVA